ncbi:hypothetical protein ACFQ7J_27285 [Streptomyces sp. NPDC056501]|uniref:hypothetical protein n=1 Tax=Streptomyces sp. NPDC056501 TaxID=3345841 RepID=UPI003676E085
MTRPLTGVERSAVNQYNWYRDEEQKARETRGDLGAMEFVLRLTRKEIAQEAKAGRTDVWPAFALVLRLFSTVLRLKRQGDSRYWTDLLTYAQSIVDQHPHT